MFAIAAEGLVMLELQAVARPAATTRRGVDIGAGQAVSLDDLAPDGLGNVAGPRSDLPGGPRTRASGAAPRAPLRCLSSVA